MQSTVRKISRIIRDFRFLRDSEFDSRHRETNRRYHFAVDVARGFNFYLECLIELESLLRAMARNTCDANVLQTQPVVLEISKTFVRRSRRYGLLDKLQTRSHKF